MEPVESAEQSNWFTETFKYVKSHEPKDEDGFDDAPVDFGNGFE
jgi:hypothetical protein